ncbi:MAG: cold shock domain-containing protein [Bacilli bacterium]|nr:cold shock domain-containing protein [Bacilli bacterium]
MEQDKIYEGKVKWYDKKNDYGIIISDELDFPIFVHKIYLEELQELNNEDLVTFNLAKKNNIYHALKTKVLKKGKNKK